MSEPIDNSNERLNKILVFYGLNLHYLLFFIGYLVRYTRHKNLGIINLNEPRPTTYKLKIILQVVMALTTLVMAADTSVDSNGKRFFEPLALVYVLYSAMWFMGIHLQYFEYKRNIPHAWYGHQMFWTLSVLMNMAAFSGIFFLLDEYNFSRELLMMVKYIAVHSILIVVSIVLAYMGFKYKREHPQHLRNYLASPNPIKILSEPLLVAGAGKGNSEALRNTQLTMATTLARIPIIKGAISCYSIENGSVLFKVLTFKDNNIQ